MLDVRFLKSSLFVGLSLLSVQGTAYLLQIVAAAQLSPVEYSVVRVTESSAAVAALLVSFGIPSAILVLASSAKDNGERTGLVLAAAILVLSAAALFALVAFSIDLTALTIGLAVLTALRLLLSSTAQAQLNFGSLAAASLVACAASLSTFGFLRAADVPAFVAWGSARLALEAFLIIALLLRGLLRGASSNIQLSRGSFYHVASLAAPLGASLAMRSLVEHGPIMWLVFIGAPVETAAQVGLVITIGTIALVPATVAQSVLVPRLARDTNALDLRLILKLFVGCGVITAVVFIAGLFSATLVVSWAKVSPGLATGAVAVVLAKMIAGICGGLLLVLRKGRIILLLNTASLTLGLVIAFLTQKLILAGLASADIIWIIAGVESVAAALYVFSLMQCARPRS